MSAPSGPGGVRAFVVRRSLRRAADPSVFHLHSACWHVALCLNRMDRDSRSSWQASLRSPRRPSSPSTPSRRLGRAFDHEQDRERELVATMRDALAEATSMLEAKAQARRHDERVPPSRVDALEDMRGAINYSAGSGWQQRGGRRCRKACSALHLLVSTAPFLCRLRRGHDASERRRPLPGFGRPSPVRTPGRSL